MAEAEQSKEEKRCTDSVTAFVESQTFMKERLKSPSTASFPWTATKVQYLGDCKHGVLSYVDSQNDFGATIRTTYYMKLQYIKGSNNRNRWRLLDLQVEN